MTQENKTKCPVCESPLSEPRRKNLDAGVIYYECPLCGGFALTESADEDLPGLLKGDATRRSLLSHFIRRRAQRSREPFVWNYPICALVIERERLPGAKEQADNAIRWLGDSSPGPGETLSIRPGLHASIIGAKSDDGFAFIVNSLVEAGCLKGKLTMGGMGPVALTFKGWERYEELRRGAPSGSRAFMAMEYGDLELDRMVNEHFRPAVLQTGFTLYRLDDVPKAGLIDDHLRLEIQGARFLIVDLTRANNGAYWEAGYAEGLGKPVIFTCEASRFKSDSHFDTNHQLHVLWTVSTAAEAMKKLKATIRATIPEARRQDGPE